MSYAVWQYQLKATTRQEVRMPFGSKVLRLAVHNDIPSLWVLVDCRQQENPECYREFHLYATDELIAEADTLQYIGSIGSESTVLHCFEAARVII